MVELTAILIVLQSLALVGAVVRFLMGLWGKRLLVKRITRPHDQYVARALLLLRRIPQHLLDSPEDIRRWLSEMEQHREDAKKAGEQLDFDEFFLVAVRGRDVLAVFYSTYCFESRFMFVSYLAVREGSRIAFEDGVDEIVKYLRKVGEKSFPEWRGLVFEVEPENRARVRLFKGMARGLGFVAGELDFDYVQPKFSLDALEDQRERRLHLIYVPIDIQWGDEPEYLTREQFCEILDFIYGKVYWNAYEEVSKKPQQMKEYHGYLQELLDGTKARIPEKVRFVSN